MVPAGHKGARAAVTKHAPALVVVKASLYLGLSKKLRSFAVAVCSGATSWIRRSDASAVRVAPTNAASVASGAGIGVVKKRASAIVPCV